MNLHLADNLHDPQLLWQELERHWSQGDLVGLAPAQERAALRAAVQGEAAGEPSAAVQQTWHPDGAATGNGASAESWQQNHWGSALVLGSGGSSGGRRWCLQPLSHLQASARACGSWLNRLGIAPERCLHLNALPLHHVSGLLPLVRTQEWGAELRWLPPELMREPMQLPQACLLPRQNPVLLSLVPTQLQRLLDCPEATDWLRGCAVIWVGGASLAEDLAERARTAGLPLAPCYGATETAAMVCALPPERFRAGEPGCGPALDDVELRLEADSGAIAVRSRRLSPGWFRAGRLEAFGDADGWWRSGDAGRWSDHSPDRPADDPMLQQDLGNPAEDPSLLIRGRLDGAILSGGETVFPEQVERRLREAALATGLPLAAVLLLGVEEEPWGERLMGLVRPRDGADGSVLIQGLETLTTAWPPPERPRRWKICHDLAPNEQGKWERARWRERLRHGANRPENDNVPPNDC